MKYFDSHAHYYDERFVNECNEGVDNLVGALMASSVSYIINVATSPENCVSAINQAKKWDNMYTALDIHPSDTRFVDDLDGSLRFVEGLIKEKANKCVCLGEIGLDYHYPDTDKDKQMRYFMAQMELARALKIPVCIHDREAHEDCLEVIKKFPDVIGIMHSFSGSREMAREIASMGYYVSFSGTITFTNAKKPKEACAAVPREQILIETDCPYLAPHPLRGTLNHSGNLKYTNLTVASILGIDEEEAAQLTENNAKRIFGL